MVEQIFFQSSMPRSGSTIFQNLIGQNPDFYVTPTSGVLELIFGARANFSTSPEFKAQDTSLMEAGFKEFCNKGIFAFYNAITDKKFVLDKSRGWGVYRPFLSEVYPNPKIICMVRDLRSVVCSYEKIYRKSQLRKDPIRNDLTGAGTTIHKRVDEWVHPTNTIGRAVERIFEMIRLGYDDKILFVKYEDLCLYTEIEMRRIYDYLELPYFEHDFDNIQQITSEDDSVYGLTNDLHTIKPKLELPTPDYHDILGKDICAWLYNTYKWYFDKFQYKGLY
jgi:sulfotransferase